MFVAVPAAAPGLDFMAITQPKLAYFTAGCVSFLAGELERGIQFGLCHCDIVHIRPSLH